MDERRKHILFTAKFRGMKEVEELMGQFAENNLESMQENDLDDFQELLKYPDRDILGWVLGREPAPPEIQTPVLRSLISFKKRIAKS